MLNKCIDNAPFTVTVNKAILVYSGQGDGDTKWNGWSWKLLLIKFVIYIIYYKSCSFVHKLKAPKMNRTSIIILTVLCSTVEL